MHGVVLQNRVFRTRGRNVSRETFLRKSAPVPVAALPIAAAMFHVKHFCVKSLPARAMIRLFSISTITKVSLPINSVT